MIISHSGSSDREIARPTATAPELAKCSCQSPGKVSFRGDRDVIEFEPTRQQAEFVGELGGHPDRIDPFLEEGSENAEGAGGAIALQAGPGAVARRRMSITTARCSSAGSPPTA